VLPLFSLFLSNILSHPILARIHDHYNDYHFKKSIQHRLVAGTYFGSLQKNILHSTALKENLRSLVHSHILVDLILVLSLNH